MHFKIPFSSVCKSFIYLINSLGFALTKIISEMISLKWLWHVLDPQADEHGSDSVLNDEMNIQESQTWIFQFVSYDLPRQNEQNRI